MRRGPFCSLSSAATRSASHAASPASTRWPGDHQPHYYPPKAVSEPDADEAEAVARAVQYAEDYLGRKLRAPGAIRPRPEGA